MGKIGEIKDDEFGNRHIIVDLCPRAKFIIVLTLGMSCVAWFTALVALFGVYGGAR